MQRVILLQKSRVVFIFYKLEIIHSVSSYPFSNYGITCMDYIIYVESQEI